MSIAVAVQLGLDGSTWKTPLADITWTTVTADVLHQDGLSITRGRSTGRDEVRAGTCSFTLQDFDRTYDPENTAGAHYGFLNPGVPVRVIAGTTEELVWGDEDLDWGTDPATWDTYYPRFLGFVEDFPQGSQDPADKRVLIPIDATDAFGMLALGRQPRSVLETEIVADAPVAYWPLDEQSGSVMVDASGNGNDGTYVAGTTALSSTLDWFRGLTIPTGDEWYGLNTDAAVYVGALPIALEAVVAKVGDSAPSGIVLRLGKGNPSDDSLMGFSSGYLYGGAKFAGSTAKFSSSIPEVDDGELHHIVYRRAGSAHAIYLDGVSLAATDPVFNIATQIAGAWVASRPDFGGYVGFLAHVAIYDTDLSEARIAVHASAVTAPLDRQTTTERIEWILDQAGFPAGDRDMTAGYTTLGPAVLNEEFTLDLIRRVEQTEQGRFFIAQDGVATFHARYHGQLVASPSSATFSDDGADVGYSQVEVARPRAFIYNKVTVTADGLAPLTVSDSTSIDAHGERETGVDAPLLPSAAAQRALAEYVLTNSKDPQFRVVGMSIPLHKNLATLAPIVLPLEQGARVNFERTPVGAGAAIDLDQTLEGYTERFDTKTWTWTPHLSPAEPVTFTVWGGSDVAVNHWGMGVWGY